MYKTGLSHFHVFFLIKLTRAFSTTRHVNYKRKVHHIAKVFKYFFKFKSISKVCLPLSTTLSLKLNKKYVHKFNVGEATVKFQTGLKMKFFLYQEKKKIS